MKFSRHTLGSYLKLYGKLTAMDLQNIMEYRVDFIIGVFGFILAQLGGLLFIGLVFQQIPNLIGWSFDQVLFIYGFSLVPLGIDHLVTSNIWVLASQLVVTGQFDSYLVRPINPLFFLIASKFQVAALGEVLLGASVLAVASARLGLVWGPWEFLVLPVLLLGGTLVYTGVKLFFASLAFWVKYSQAFVSLAYNFSSFGKYPLSIYPPVIQGFLTFVLPFAFTAFVPASWYLGKLDLPSAAGTTLVAGLLTSLAGYGMWRVGLRAYESAGS